MHIHFQKLMAAAKTIATTSLGTYYYCWNDAGITANANGQDLTSLLEAHLSLYKWQQIG